MLDFIKLMSSKEKSDLLRCILSSKGLLDMKSYTIDKYTFIMIDTGHTYDITVKSGNKKICRCIYSKVFYDTELMSLILGYKYDKVGEC